MSLKRILLIAGVALVVLYGGDYLRVRYRMAHPQAGDAFGSVTVVDATTLKNGKTEFFLDQAQKQVCVHALFPHFGDSPCWYASRKTVKTIE